MVVHISTHAFTNFRLRYGRQLLLFRFWTVTVFTFFKKRLKLLEIPYMEGLKQKGGFRLAERIILFEIASHFN